MLLVAYAPPAMAWGSNLIRSNIGSYKPTQKEISLSRIIKAKPAFVPPLDHNLPTDNRLIISKIGVSTTLQEATLDNYESALRKGVWRVADFGSPDDRSRPTILAAHRYGYLAWTQSFRLKNSFYNLPKLTVGDTVEIDYAQRKYTYEIYAEDKGTEITDYTADLILYTCENLTGEERVFKYARLVI